MLRLTLKRYLRERGLTETDLADAIADALIESGVTVSERYLRYLVQNNKPLTEDNSLRKPSLVMLGFILTGLRRLTGEDVGVGDVLEYQAARPASIPQYREPMFAGTNEPIRTSHHATETPSLNHALVYVGRNRETDAILDEVRDLVIHRLKGKGYERLGNALEVLTSGESSARAEDKQPRRRGRRGIIMTLLVLLLGTTAYVAYDHFVLRPQLIARYASLYSFRDRVRPSSELAVPTLIGPEGNIDQLAPTLRISEVSGAVAYEFYVEDLVSNEGVYTGPIPNSAFPIPEHTLCPNTSYAWRARTLGDDGWTSFSSSAQFTVTSDAVAPSQVALLELSKIANRPEMPTITAPIGSTSTTTPTLAVEPAPNVMGYGFYIRDLATDKVIYDNNFVTEPSAQVPPDVLEDGGVYQWNTRARNCHEWSEFTPAQIFTVNVNE